MTLAEDLGIEGIDEIEALDIEDSVTYRARQISHDRPVVVKLLESRQKPLIPNRLGLRRRQLARFASEEGVVSVYETGLTSNCEHYLMMPYFRIGSMADQLRHGPMPWHRAAELIERTARIVARAHDLGLVLEDLRPSSIMLADPSSPLISLYGMAAQRFDDGAPSYRAPEAGRGTNSSPSDDVYSLTLILAALIAGRPPNRGPLSQEFLSEVEALSPRRIAEVVEHGLAPSHANRYGSAAHLASALAIAIGGDEPTDIATLRHDDADLALDLDALLPPPTPDDEVRFHPFDRQQSRAATGPLQSVWFELRRSLGAVVALAGLAVIAATVGVLVLRDFRDPSPSAGPSSTSSSPPSQPGEAPLGPTVALIRDAKVARIRATTARVEFTSSSCVIASFSYSTADAAAETVSGASRCSRSHALLLGTVTPRLVPGTAYDVTITATDTDGVRSSQELSFTTLG